jgi:hypothetical protein
MKRALEIIRGASYGEEHEREQLLSQCFEKVFVPHYGDRRWWATSSVEGVNVTFGVAGLLYGINVIRRGVRVGTLSSYAFECWDNEGTDDKEILEGCANLLIREMSYFYKFKLEHYKMMSQHPSFQVIWHEQKMALVEKSEFVQYQDVEVGDTIIDGYGFPLSVIRIKGNSYTLKDQLLTGRPVHSVRKNKTDGAYKVFSTPPAKPINRASLQFKFTNGYGTPPFPACPPTRPKKYEE